MLRYGIVVSVLVASPALAQATPDRIAPDQAAAPRPDAGDAPASSDVLVTATRTPLPENRVAAAVTLLDKASIDRNQDIAVADLILRTPGITLSRNGGYGTATQLRIRGAETDQTVVVIDGVKLNDPSSPGGGYNFANLLVGDAARIEVLRGPQSILWGSQAIGGVVNIVTAMPTRPLEGSFDVEGGSRMTADARAAIGGVTGPLAWRIGAQAFTTDGISVVAPSAGGREPDGYRNQSVQGRGLLTLAPNVSVDLRGYWSNGDTDLDGFGVDDREYALEREFVGYAGLNVDLLDGRLRNRIAYGYTDTDRDNYDPSRNPARGVTFDANGRNQRVEYQGSLRLATGWDLTAGVEHEHAAFRSVSPSASLSVPVPVPARGSADLTGEYAQLNAQLLPWLTLTGGVRHDEHSRFGDKTLVSGGGVLALPSGLTIRADYGEGFKAPTLYQLFSEYGNGALAPEQANGWEAGAEQHLLGGRVVVGGTYFERRTTDQILFLSCTATSTNPLCFQPGSTTRRSGYYQNVAQAFAKGIEAAASARVGGLLLDGNYTWNPSQDRSPGAATYGLQLPRRARHTANASATYTWHGASLGVAARYAGESFDNAANTTRLAPYTLVDFRAEAPISGKVALFGRVENAFDESYQTIYRYGTLGRSVYAGLRGRF